MTEKISNEKKVPNDVSIKEIISEIGKKRHQLDKLSKLIDYAVEEVMPKVFRENIEKAYKNSKKTTDFIMRHII